MWFAKWFGGRDRTDEETDEPARHAPPVAKPEAPVHTTTDPAAKAAGKLSLLPELKKGFDPYNSGAFESRNAWERVKRR